MKKTKYSLIALFGSLPVHPDLFKTLDPKLKWFGIPDEAPDGNFTTCCGSLTPEIPKSHHPACFGYRDLESYPTYKNSLGECPDCQSDDLYMDSCRDAGVSQIYCSDCDFKFSGNCDEETLENRFKKKRNKLAESKQV